jgi:hypothetical protein
MTLSSRQQVTTKLHDLIWKNLQSDFLLSSRLWGLRVTWFGAGVIVSTIIFLMLTVLIMEAEGMWHKKSLPRCSKKSIIYASVADPHDDGSLIRRQQSF